MRATPCSTLCSTLWTTVFLFVFALSFAAGAYADGTDPAAPPAPPQESGIAWRASLAEAFDAAKKEDKPVFIAINAERINGRIEPANKELREHTYLAPEVVAKSRAFVCALVRSDGGTGDYAELRGHFKIDGVITAPQHLFAYPDGTEISRREYWPTAAGQPSVDELVSMMNDALKADAARPGMPPPPTIRPTPPPGPPSGPPDSAAPGAPAAPGNPPAPAPDPAAEEAKRREWMGLLLDRLRGATEDAVRDSVIKELLAGDKGGDCVEPLCTVMLDSRKDPALQRAILRALGKPGLELAVPAVAALLEAKDDEVRSYAAVTLEYIGSARAIEPLTKRAGRERFEEAAGNVLRALGRCGAKAATEPKDAVRKLLLHEAQSAKSPEATVAPVTGLAYYEKDADAARGLERFLKKDNEPLRRSTALWALSEIGDGKSADFVRKEVIADQPKDPKGWLEKIVAGYNQAVLDVLIGGTEAAAAKGIVEGGMGQVYGFRGIRVDSARRNRDQSEFKPKGEFSGSGRWPPGGPGGQPPPPGMGG